MSLSFPSNFKFGVATSSYQIEGAANTDGRGESIWDTFCDVPGNVVNSENGDVACDHYNRSKSDVALMKSLGLQSYRFSIAWSRLFPNGDGTREQRGFDFYNELIDELISNGIEPVITLYHWDLPQTLQDKGGWANREIVDEFAFYAAEVVKAYGHKVSKWITINEPWCVSWLGYMSGVHAPGVKDLSSAVAASHHTVMAHAVAANEMRKVNPDIEIGIALNMTNYIVDNPADRELAELEVLMDSHINRWWLDAAFKGEYPKELAAEYGDKLTSLILPGDYELMKVATDFIGVNYYSDSFLGTPQDSDGPMSEGGLFPFKQRSNGTTPEPKTDMGWPITPEGIGDLLIRMSTDWPMIKAISITENGAAFGDEPDENGEVNDHRRVSYLEEHLKHVARAVAAGAPVTSYFAWSFMDNFEWAEGYAKRFGIVHVNFQTLVRTPKLSAKVFSSIVRNHVQSLETTKV